MLLRSRSHAAHHSRRMTLAGVVPNTKMGVYPALMRRSTMSTQACSCYAPRAPRHPQGGSCRSPTVRSQGSPLALARTPTHGCVRRSAWLWCQYRHTDARSVRAQVATTHVPCKEPGRRTVFLAAAAIARRLAPQEQPAAQSHPHAWGWPAAPALAGPESRSEASLHPQARYVSSHPEAGLCVYLEHITLPFKVVGTEGPALARRELTEQMAVAVARTAGVGHS